MKTFISKSLLLGTALMLATSLFAADKTSITTYAPITVSGKQLQAGHYTVQWEGSGSVVQMSILRDKSVVAVTPARWVELKLGADSSGYSLTNNADGSQSLSEVRLHDKKYALVIGGEAAARETASTK
jgi:hypothetical protein